MKVKKPNEITIEELSKKQKNIEVIIYILLIVTALLLLIIAFLF